MYELNKIHSFTDLHAWQESHQLVLLIFKITGTFPNNQQFALTLQIQRATISITSNIAEGFSRKSKKEKIQFYYMSLGSLTELQNQLLIARDLHYTNKQTFNKLAEKTITVIKLLNGLIKSANILTT